MYPFLITETCESLCSKEMCLGSQLLYMAAQEMAFP